MLVIILVLLTVLCACGISWFYSLWSVIVIILGSTDCVVCLWHSLVLPTVVCACDNSGSTDCVVCLWHFLVLLTVVCDCDNSWFY